LPSCSRSACHVDSERAGDHATTDSRDVT
jgi:hypothetical protein